MKLQLFKNNFKLQIIYFLMLSAIGMIVFSLISVVITTSFFDVTLEELQSTSEILKKDNARQILLFMVSFQTIGMILLPVIIFTTTVLKSPVKELKFNLNSNPVFLFTLVFFSISGIIIVGFLGEMNLKIPLPDWMGKVETDVNNTIEYILSPKGKLTFFYNSLFLAVLPAIGEELFFRGILQRLFSKVIKKQSIAVLITAAIFSAFHFQFQTFLPRFFMGIMLGYLFIWSGSILVPMLAHFLHNFLSILAVKISDLSGVALETEQTNYLVLGVSILVFSGLSCWYYSLHKKKPIYVS